VESALPEFVSRLLWDVDASLIDPHRDSALIFERVMGRGSWEAMRWLRARYSREELASFLRSGGAKRLSPRDLAYWSLVCGLDGDVGVGGGRPSWAG